MAEEKKIYRIEKQDVDNIAEAIRAQLGEYTLMTVKEMPEHIRSIAGGGGVTIDDNGSKIYLKGEYVGTELLVTKNTIIDLRNLLAAKEIPLDIQINVPIPEGYLKPEGTFETIIEGTYDVTPYASATFTIQKEQVSVTPTEEKQTLTPSENKYFNEVVVNPIPSEYIIPGGNIEITNTDEVDVTNYAIAQIVDENLKPENIAENIEVLGIVGTFRGGIDTSDGTATSDDLLLGKIAYANDERIVGTIETYDYSASEEVKPEIDKFITGEITEIYNDRVTTLAAYAMRPISASVVKLSFPNVVTCNTSIYACAKATEVYLPKVTSIGNQEFQGCTKLHIVEIPNITRIEANSFSGCKELEKLEFNNLTYIASSAFSGCSAFKTLILRGDSVCQLAGVAPYFKDTLIASGTGYVYVKDELVEQYKIATNWSTIADQIKPISEYVEEEK